MVQLYGMSQNILDEFRKMEIFFIEYISYFIVSQGWNKSYPFNTGDLVISKDVLYNYLEASNRIPWEDLRYLFGEIMYGGHITDDWDRRLCKVCLIRKAFLVNCLFNASIQTWIY